MCVRWVRVYLPKSRRTNNVLKCWRVLWFYTDASLDIPDVTMCGKWWESVEFLMDIAQRGSYNVIVLMEFLAPHELKIQSTNASS